MFAYIGCFTARAGSQGKGISVYRVAEPGNAWSLVQVIEAPANPGYLVLDQQQRFLYVSHGGIGEVSSYTVDKRAGRLALLNRQPTSGDNAPHLTIDPTGRYVVVAHGPGIAVFPINSDGSLAPLCDAVIPPGESGPYRREQKRGAHPHQIVFDPSGRFLVAPDKGVDRVHVYRLDTATGKLVANDPVSVKCRYGAGPRHIAFHPDRRLAYLVNELDSTVTAYRWESERGELRPFQVLPTTPATYTGDNTGAEIAVAPSGRFAYVSNRGHDSMVTFSVDPDSGMLTPVGWEPTLGKVPHFFTSDAGGNLFYVANQASGSIVAMRVDHDTGKLTCIGPVAETGTPTCIAFAHA